MRAMGWRFAGELPNLPKFVAIVAPHTSNWDFIVGLAAKWALGVDATWLGKHTLFVWPFSLFFRAIGGIPVDRSSANNVVDETVRAFAQRPRMVLALSPEGTRKKVPHWRTGFWHIARGAGVPIVIVAFDWGTKSIRFGPVIEAEGDADENLPRVKALFADTRGRRPENQ